MSDKVVFVSGCFDLLHSGHLEFLQQAASFGRLLVALGSDSTIKNLKGRDPICLEQERLFLVRGLRCVSDAFISSGSGSLDFEPELRHYKPDLLVVNTDGDSPSKRALCNLLGVEYVVLQRLPRKELPCRTTSALRSSSKLPFRLDLAGGWLDQPIVSRLHPGPVIVVSLQGHCQFSGRCGMATSTRNTAERIWGDRLPSGDPEELARILFAVENPPGTEEISGSQDALGIVLPGVNRLNYQGGFWPASVLSLRDPTILNWLAKCVSYRRLSERPSSFRVLDESHISVAAAKALAESASRFWDALNAKDIKSLGTAMRDSFLAQVSMFPRMKSPEMNRAIDHLPKSVFGFKIAGAGGGGYLIAVSERPPPNFESIQIRHADG